MILSEDFDRVDDVLADMTFLGVVGFPSRSSQRKMQLGNYMESKGVRIGARRGCCRTRKALIVDAYVKVPGVVWEIHEIRECLASLSGFLFKQTNKPSCYGNLSSPLS